MENLLVLYIASFSFFYLLGRASVLCLEILFQKSYNYIFDLKIESFYIFFGIYISSQFLFVMNFFYGLNKINLGFCFFIILFINFFKIKKIKDYKYLLLNFSSASILFISFYDISLSKDSFLYHLSTQSWIYSEKIVFGISNLNPYLGYVSVSEYLMTLLNIFNIKGSHIFNLLFIFFFFSLLISFVFSNINFYKNLAFSISIFGILDNFGFGGGRNGFIALQEINKFDYTVSILLILFLIFFLYINFNKKTLSSSESLFLIVLLTFISQLRFFAILLFPLLIYQIIKFKGYRKNQIFPLLLLFVWLIKSFINTSCFIFPVYLTCFDSSWFFKDQAKYISYAVLDSYRDPNISGINSINNTEWISKSFFQFNLYPIINFFITLLLFFGLKKYLLKNVDSKNFKRNNLINISSCIALLLFWFYYLPQYRFSSFFFIGIFLIINLDYFLTMNKGNIGLFIILIFISLALINNLNDYKNFFMNPFSVLSDNQQYTVGEYEKRDTYGYKPIGEVSKNVFCFEKRDCYSGNYSVNKKDLKFNYIAIIPIDSSYYSNLLD